MVVQLRKLIPSETLQYRKIRLECLEHYPDHFGSTAEEESQITKLKFEQFILSEDSDNFMMGFFDQNNLIGICGFERENRAKTKHRGEIVQMYVKPEFSGNNFGKMLLTETVKTAFFNQEIEQIKLSVVYENTKAISLYEKIGFEEYGIIRNYFKSDKKYWNQRFMILYRDRFVQN